MRQQARTAGRAVDRRGIPWVRGEDETRIASTRATGSWENRKCESGTNGGFLVLRRGGLGSGAIAGPGETHQLERKAALAKRGAGSSARPGGTAGRPQDDRRGLYGRK